MFGIVLAAHFILIEPDLVVPGCNEGALPNFTMLVPPAGGFYRTAGRARLYFSTSGGLGYADSYQYADVYIGGNTAHKSYLLHVVAGVQNTTEEVLATEPIALPPGEYAVRLRFAMARKNDCYPEHVEGAIPFSVRP